LTPFFSSGLGPPSKGTIIMGGMPEGGGRKQKVPEPPRAIMMGK
jgi:hypothetical protein